MQHVSNSFVIRRQERPDVEADVLTFLIRQFKRRKFDQVKGANAFAYFTSCAFNRFKRELGNRARRRSRELTFSALIVPDYAGIPDVLMDARPYSSLRAKAS